MVLAGRLWRFRLRWGWSLAAFALDAGCALLFSAPASVAATATPEVGYRSASDVSTTGATIEVPINPEGGETSCEIWLECGSAQDGKLQAGKLNCEPLTGDQQRAQGVLAAGLEPQVVTDKVTGLQPEYLYKYGVIATNSAGRAGYIGEGFLTCPSEGVCPYQPYLLGQALWTIEAGNLVAAEKLREQREKEAAEATAAKEREAREAGERAGREAAQRVASDCVVPRLKGDTLAAARRALDRVHCRLGRLTKPRRLRGPLIVVKQSVRSNSELAPGSRVALTLGVRAKRQAARMS
jgi:hypothetical protein